MNNLRPLKVGDVVVFEPPLKKKRYFTIQSVEPHVYHLVEIGGELLHYAYKNDPYIKKVREL